MNVVCETSNHHSIIVPTFAALCKIEICTLINLQTAFNKMKQNLQPHFSANWHRLEHTSMKNTILNAEYFSCRETP